MYGDCSGADYKSVNLLELGKIYLQPQVMLWYYLHTTNL